MKTVSVACCLAGEKGKIVELKTEDRTILGKLMSLGMVPGTRICILRCRPALLLEAGHTKVALDRELAACIRIELLR